MWVGAFPNASPAACHAPSGGPDSRNFKDALRNRPPDVPDEGRDMVAILSSEAIRFGGSMGEYGVGLVKFPFMVW